MICGLRCLLERVKPCTCAPESVGVHGPAGITVSPSLKWTPSISAREKGFSVVSCRISAFMLLPMCLAQTTWKASGWLHAGRTKEHLRWTLWPMSSGVITGRDGSDGTAAGNTQRSKQSKMDGLDGTYTSILKMWCWTLGNFGL